MANGVKYIVSAKHLQSFERGKRRVFQTRVISMRDDLDDAINDFLNTIKCEDDCSQQDLRDVIEELQEIKETDRNLTEGGSYDFVFETMHDYPGRYIGPGSYSLEKTVLS